jgi:hypothetical protein
MLTKIASVVLQMIAVTAVVVDAFNASQALTNGQDFYGDPFVFSIRVALAVSIAALAWVGGIFASQARRKRNYFALSAWVFVMIFVTIFNVLCSIAYMSHSWTPLHGVGGALSVPIPFTPFTYATVDWFRDLTAAMGNIILLILVVVNLEEGFRMSPEEERKKYLYDLEMAKIAEERERHLAPMLAARRGRQIQGAADTGKQLAEQGLGMLGIKLKPKKPVALVVEEPAGEPVVEEAAAVALLPNELGTVLIGKILGVTERTIRDRMKLPPVHPNYIYGYQKGSRGIWVSTVDWMHEHYAREMQKYEMKERNRQMPKPKKQAAPTAMEA